MKHKTYTFNSGSTKIIGSYFYGLNYKETVFKCNYIIFGHCSCNTIHIPIIFFD